jgi:D-sedoheptulose 7-phosphate isomerase
MQELQTIDDPRARNVTRSCASATEFRRSYVAQLSAALEAAPITALETVAQMLTDVALEGRRVFVIGNGGSASIADHVSCDLVKGTASRGHPNLDVTSLSANVALYTATANDFGFETVFERQIESFGRPGDLLIAISSSGNSENILRGVASAQRHGLDVVGLCGFDGGRLKDAADVVLHAPVSNYGLVEDTHMAWIHIIAQMIGLRRDRLVPW